MKLDFRTILPKNMLILLLISMLVRGFFATWIALGNDEVYYWTYALFPDWSHFDHPPMVGWFIQLFSLNLLFDSELFIRMSSVIMMTVNTLLVFHIGKKIAGERTGFYAALLYTASIYAFVITGIFILPDTPQNFFWFLGLWSFLNAFSDSSDNTKNCWMLLAGLFTGLGILSKYTTVFLWFGAGLYILFYARKWLKAWSLYVAVLLSFLLLFPVIWWNIQNDFISFSFQGERVNLLAGSLRPDLLLMELSGQILYNNPINFVLIILGLISAFRSKLMIKPDIQKLLLLMAVPLIGLFLFFSLFRSTLPHWTSPGYNTLLFFAAAWLATSKKISASILPKPIIAALGLLAVIIVVGSLQIKFGLIPFRDNNSFHQLGKNDVTLDMYGWRGLDKPFEEAITKHVQNQLMPENAPIISNNWFPLAHLDYYVARPLQLKVLGIGKPEKLHKYLWINQERGGFDLGTDYWYMTNSRDYVDPLTIYEPYFREIIPADTLTIMRAGKPAKHYFIFMLKDLKKLPEQALLDSQ
ncbi:MAG: glycosyltransferase family 39 protein [Bacteroidetes bacterium]|jgi:hypothetical protein|nr:glycosyltransferase family 39 protein [Bacteroidota bacterium]